MPGDATRGSGSALKHLIHMDFMAALDHAAGAYPGRLLEWLETETIVRAMPPGGQLKWKYVVCSRALFEDADGTRS
jgi:hypothetical protein